MKVVVERIGGGPVKFEEFADGNGLDMLVFERGGSDPDGLYYAHFDRVDLAEGGCLVGAFGNGSTPESAIAAYRERVRGKRLVVDAGSPDRREIQCPTEWLL